MRMMRRTWRPTLSAALAMVAAGRFRTLRMEQNNRMRMSLLAIGLVAGISCRGTSASSPRNAPARAPSAAVYARILDSIFVGRLPDTIVVRDSTLVFAGAGPLTVESFQREYDAFPSDLVARLIEISSPRRSAESLGIRVRPIRFFTSEDRANILLNNPNDFWMHFRERFADASGLLTFSPVAFSTDGTQALLYYDYACGGRCGNSDLVWLSPGSNKRWQIRKVLTLRRV